MSTQSADDLMTGLLSKLYKTITGADENIKLPRNKFVSWFMPGLAFKPEDFEFLYSIGDTAEKVRQFIEQEFIFSKLFDYVPEIPPENDGYSQFNDSDEFVQTLYSLGPGSLSSIYDMILKYSKIANLGSTEEEKKELERLRSLLVVSKKVTNLATGEEMVVEESSPLVIAYNEKMTSYLKVANEYMNLLTDAQSAKGNDELAIKRVKLWQNTAQFKKLELQAALSDWVTTGYKNVYDDIVAQIQLITQRDMVLYKKKLQDAFNLSLVTSAKSGMAGDYYPVRLIPPNFATSEGWTKFEYYSQDTETHTDTTTKKWEVEGKLRWKLTTGGTGGTSRTEDTNTTHMTEFGTTFEFTQCIVLRNWFEPLFLKMANWILDQNWYEFSNGLQVSDGAERPVGKLVAYPTNALFVRNVEITFDEANEVKKDIDAQLGAGGNLGLGLFSLGGKYTKSTHSTTVETSLDKNTLKIPGIQLIGTINSLIGKSPDPDPAIKLEDFV